MIEFQKKVLTQLNNDPELKKLKLTFFNDSNILNYSAVFYFIYYNIKNKLKKVKACGGKIYTITFNYTNPLGVVLYNNTIVIDKCKKTNYYSINTTDIIIESYNNFIKGVLFNNSVLNELAQEAIASSDSTQWFSKENGKMIYTSAYTPGSNGATSTDGVSYSLTKVSGYENYNASGLTSYGNYTGLSFPWAYNGSITFTNIPTGTVFGMLSIGEGGDGNKYYGGGGAGIIYTEDLSSIGLSISPNVDYKVELGWVYYPNDQESASVFGPLISYGGYNGTDIGCGKGGFTNIDTSIYPIGSYNGGDGGYNTTQGEDGKNSSLISVIIPNTNGTIYCGGGGGTKGSSSKCNGGQGYGGVSYPSGTIKKNENGYQNLNGGNYGGGGGGGGIGV